MKLINVGHEINILGGKSPKTNTRRGGNNYLYWVDLNYPNTREKSEQIENINERGLFGYFH